MSAAIGAGVVLGVLYTLSPLTVLGLAALTILVRFVARDLGPRERHWFIGLVAFATALRLAAIAGLFLFADAARPYANFFGDEELLKNRTVWLRNVGLGVPISPADMIYLFDDVGRTSYLYVLAYIQALMGDAPYGNNVLSTVIYVAAVVLMFAFFRRAYGRVAALASAAVLLFLPSLFSWSISVLKEPAYILFAGLELICAVQILCARTITRRLCAAVGVAASAVVLGSLRIGGTELAVGGVLIGVPAALLVTRPKWLWVAVAAAPVIVVAAGLQPRVQERVMRSISDTAFLHWGHVATPGVTYRVLDPRFYIGYDRAAVHTMTAPEAARFVIRAGVEFLTAPRPSQIESRSALAYLPEQAIWYVILALVPFGVASGLARAPVVTCLLMSHALVASAMVALTGGNIGTLIRHRGLVVPYLVLLAAFGACSLLSRTRSRSTHEPFAFKQGVRYDLC
jgi:hypothetical protein